MLLIVANMVIKKATFFQKNINPGFRRAKASAYKKQMLLKYQFLDYTIRMLLKIIFKQYSNNFKKRNPVCVE